MRRKTKENKQTKPFSYHHNIPLGNILASHRTSLYVCIKQSDALRVFFATEYEVDLLERLTATENLVQELLQEVNILKSQDRIRGKKVAYLEQQFRLQRQRNSQLDMIIKKIATRDKKKDLGQAEMSPVLIPEKAGVNKDRG